MHVCRRARPRRQELVRKHEALVAVKQEVSARTSQLSSEHSQLRARLAEAQETAARVPVLEQRCKEAEQAAAERVRLETGCGNDHHLSHLPVSYA